MVMLEPLRKRRGSLLYAVHRRLEKDKTYYEQFLRQKEAELLNSVGDSLKIELILYDLRKLRLRALDLGDEGNTVAQQLRDQDGRLRRLLSVEQDRLADLELDIAPC